MRKHWATIPLVCLALVGSTPFFMGIWAKSKVNQLISQVPLPDGVYIEVRDYHLGYTSSSFALYIRALNLMNNGGTEGQQFEFITQANMQHGPIFKTNDGWTLGLARLHGSLDIDDLLMMSAEAKDKARPYFQSNELVSLDATVDLTGRVSATFATTQVHFQDPNGTLQWGGLDGAFVYSGSFGTPENKVGVHISPMLLQAKGPQSALVDLSEIKIYSETSMAKENLWVGSQTMSIPSFLVKDEQGNTVRFDHFNASGSSGIKHDLADVQMHASAKNMQIFMEKINSMDFSLNIGKLDVKSLEDFANLSNNASDTMTSADKQAVTAALIGMLSSGAELNVNHAMNLDSGPAKLQLTVAFPNLTVTQSNEKPEVLAQKLIAQLKASVNLSMPAQWSEEFFYRLETAGMPNNLPPFKDPQTGAMITPQEAMHNDLVRQFKVLRDEQVLLTQGDHYTLSLTYNQGVTTLNGKTLSQDDMQRISTELTPQGPRLK